MTQPVLGIAGWKNSGKTILTTRLVEELTSRGLRISTVKHAHHDAIVDHEGTDSYRHRAAGATEVALVTANRWALMHELRGAEEPPLADILARLAPVDLVIVEGYKREAIPKIEVRRDEAMDQTPLADPHVIATAGDVCGGQEYPHFQLDDIEGIADFVVAHFGLVAR
jgi:molybdopterin-guanine dinucleotide biosynthesis protein B